MPGLLAILVVFAVVVIQRRRRAQHNRLPNEPNPALHRSRRGRAQQHARLPDAEAGHSPEEDGLKLTASQAEEDCERTTILTAAV